MSRRPLPPARPPAARPQVWQWPSAGVELYDSESFRRYLESELLTEDLRRLLPRDGAPAPAPPADGQHGQQGEGGASAEGSAGEAAKDSSKPAGPAAKPVEKPAEAALRMRM